MSTAPTLRVGRPGLLIVALGLSVVSVALHATERVSARLDATTGLPTAPIHSLVQDARDYIWVGTQGGLVRYDGHEFRRWAPELIHIDVSWLAADPWGAVVGVTGAGDLFEVTAESARLVADDEDHPVTGVTRIVFDEQGVLWIAVHGGIRWRERSGAWGSVPAVLHRGEPIRVVYANAGLVYAASRGHVWVIDRELVMKGAARSAVERLDVEGVSDGILAVGDALWLGTYTGTVVVRSGRIDRLGDVTRRTGPFAYRQGTMWVGSERALLAYHGTRRAARLGPSEGISSTGALVVDREGGLWLGNFTGLTYFPEPESVTWTDADGLPSAHVRQLLTSSEGLWVLTWQGLGRLVADGDGWNGRTETTMSGDALCADANDDVWTAPVTPGRMAHRRHGRFDEVRVGGVDERVQRCATSPAGVWVATDRGLYHVDSTTHEVSRIPGPKGRDLRRIGTLQQEGGELWVTLDEEFCRRPARAPFEPGDAEWRCERLPGVGSITSLLELSDGNVWATTRFAGVWRRADGRWSDLEPSRRLESRWFTKLRSARDGTIWVLGGGEVLRVRAENEPDAGWQVVEHIGPWQGYPGSSPTDLIEDTDGSLWIASPGGVTRVPRAARQPEQPPPVVFRASLLLNGVRVLSETLPPVKAGDTVEIRFAVPSFRDRRQLRIEGRTSADSPWFALSERDPTVRLPRIAQGRYLVTARASRDGRIWTPATTSIGFEVLPPWYQRWWASVAVMTLVAIAAWTLHRFRLGVTTRLHQQRVRIARDLHDELGSGLGSIGILAGLAGSDQVTDAERRRLASVIGDGAAELGAALSDIVWSLRPTPPTLEALAWYLAERAARLVPGPRPVLVTHLPDAWPRTELALVLRRNLVLIALEALRNAVRHAEAQTITFRLAAAVGSRWILEVGDDGCGLPEGEPRFTPGHGLDNLRRRAAEVGAVLRVTSARNRGTVVSLVFDVGRHAGRLA